MMRKKSPPAGHYAAFLLSILTGATLSFGSQAGTKEIFTPRGRVISEGRIFSIAGHDFDGDGRPDIAVSDFLNPPRILYNDAAREFKKVVLLASTPETAETGHGVALADFDGDGRLDIFLVYNRYPARILFGDGRGGFRDSGRAIGTPGLSGTSVRIDDIDRDGDKDAFVTYYRERTRLYLNDGSGVLTEGEQTFDGDVESGDVDGDGDPDVISLPEKGPASIWLNDKGRFVLQDRTVETGEGAFHVFLADLDADKDLDLIGLHRTGNSTLWENDGRSFFRRSEQTFNSGTRIAAGDIDGDGTTDLVIGPAVWLNRGKGRFENVQTLSLEIQTVVELADVDGDGNLDLLAAGLDRATGRADLRLFVNTLPRR